MAQVSLYGKNLFGYDIRPPSKGVVFDSFVIPPFSVLNARDGFWRKRKRMWEAFGIKGEIGRNDTLTYTGAAKSLDYYRVKEGIKNKSDEIGTSVFDSTLTELMYTWFCPKRGQIIDPFAGGSVRGVVASLLGFDYWGCDLRQEQIDANIKQGLDICEKQPIWVCGDSFDLMPDAPKSDFIFSCPPYVDLEKYSENPRDLSNMEYHTFIPALKRIILKSYLRLNNNRFACFVVGDFRDKKGFYRNFVSDTISSFLEVGFKLYNDAILVTSVGSGSMRVTKQFNASRKFVKTHQNILVFIKGDPREATRQIITES